MEPRFVARQRGSGQISVVCRADIKPVAGGSTFGVISLLSRPGENMVFRNLAVASGMILNGPLRVAILWSPSSEISHRSVLYIYELPESIYSESCLIYEESSDSGRPVPVVVGKRIMSIDYNSGGVHHNSPQYARCSARLNSLGGLQLPSCTFGAKVYPLSMDYQKCFVWGPTTARGSTSINVKIIDLNLADPHHLVYFGNTRMRQSTAYMQPPFWFNQELCACSLHDERLRVHLPSLSDLAQVNDVTQAASSSDKDKSYWPWNKAALTRSQNPVGLTYADPSRQRKAALERVEVLLRDRLKVMQEAGMSDSQIKGFWLSYPWTCYGQIRRPEGWRAPIRRPEGWRDPTKLPGYENCRKPAATKAQGWWIWTGWSS